jgi:hypothetical protein
VLINNHRELKVVGKFFLKLVNKYFFLPFLHLEYKLRLQAHVVIALDSFYFYFIVVLIVFVLFCQSTLIDQQTVELSVPVVQDSKHD